MAKPLPERIQSALSPGSRAATIEALIADVEAEHARIAPLLTAAEADSVDPLLGEVDQDEAETRADRTRRDMGRLSQALTDLRAKLAERVGSDRAHAIQADYADARDERDKLAADLRGWWAEHMPAMFAILDRLARSDERIAQVNSKRPGSAEWLEGAEATARGVPGNFSMPGGCGPVERLAQWRIPNFNGAGHVWPRPWNPAVSLGMDSGERHAA